MDERTFLLQTHDASENANEENSTTVTSLNGGRDASLQESEIHELQILLDKAQTLLENQPEENAVASSFLPRWLIRYLLLLSIIWQVLCIGVLSIVDLETKKTPSHHTVKVTSNVILTVFTAVHLIVVILITMRVAAKVAAHTATFTFLLQAYLSTVLLFSGLYTLFTRFECHSFRHIDERGGTNYCDSSDEKILISLFIRLLYFSVSNSTLCGITDIQPNKWYTELTVALQMLLSFLYFASILTHTNHKKTTQQTSTWQRIPLLRKLKTWLIKVSS